MSHPHGTLYMAAKKHYFGVGGGTREFLSMVEKDGKLCQRYAPPKYNRGFIFVKSFHLLFYLCLFVFDQ